MEKLKYIHYLLFARLTLNVFVPELDILNVNLTSQIPLFLLNVECNKFKHTYIHDLIKHIYIYVS